jgi:hypothetical protein
VCYAYTIFANGVGVEEALYAGVPLEHFC